MELVFIFAIVFFEVSLVDLLKVVKIIWTFRMDTFMDNKVLPFFLRDKCIAAMGAAQLDGRKAAFRRGEPGGTDLAEDLAFGAVVFVEEGLGAAQRWQVHSSGMSHSERRLTGRIFLP